jgi:hypothetical protein
MLFVDSEKSIPADVRSVLDAAALLQVTEFRLFQIAYRYWHGRDTSDHAIERHFISYMFWSVVPFWVRQLCRRVLAAEAEGALNPRDFGVEPLAVQLRPYEVCRRAFAVAGTLAVMLLLACSLYLAY